MQAALWPLMVIAANAFITTNTATAAAGLTWALIEWWHNGSPTILGTVTGAVAGLVAITPACGFVNPMNAMFIGMIVAAVCYMAVAVIKAKLGYDDSLDAFGVHGVGGTVGTIATGLFAEKAVNAAGNNGLLFGNAHQLLVQCFIASGRGCLRRNHDLYHLQDCGCSYRHEG